MAAAVLLAVPGTASAQLPPVNVFTDDTDANGCTLAHCTLREHVDGAAGGETIQLQAGRYELTQGQPLSLDVGVTIEGDDARLTTIDANNMSRIGDVTNNATVTVTDVTVTAGNANAGSITPLQPGHGGAFLVEANGELRLLNTTLTGNVASFRGGAIASFGDLSFVESTASGNDAGNGQTPGQGGGIYSGGVSGNVFMFNSTLSGNSAIAAVEAPSRGGGLYTDDAFTLEHVTIAGNDASLGGGLYQDEPTPAPGFTSMWDTLIADNTGGACAGTVAGIEEDHNVADGPSCALDPTGVEDPDADRLAPLGDYGGPTDTHALLTGNPASDAARPDFCNISDQRGVLRPQSGPCDVGAYEGNIDPPSNPPSGGGGGGGTTTQQQQPQQEEEQLPPPEAGENVNVVPKEGTVRIRLKGKKKFVELKAGQQIPLKTEIDTRNGRVTLTAASNTSGGTATADFYDGLFIVDQTKGSKPTTTLDLSEKLSCPTGKAAAAAKRKKKRRLWGDGSGKFRTEGEFSSATVRGTVWLTEDRCDSTLTRVVKGSVSVRDFVKRKTVVVKAGKKYVAKRRR